MLRYAVWYVGALSLLLCAGGRSGVAQIRSAGDMARPSGPLPLVHVGTRSEMLHVVVGHALILDVPNRIRRIFISNPAVLGSLTSSPSEVLVNAKAAGISTLVVWDSNGLSSVYTVSADVDTEGVRAALLDAFPHDHVEATALQDRITLSGVVATQETADAAGKLAASYAKDVVNSLRLAPVHTSQVQLRVRIAEIDRSKAEQYGFNFASAGNNTAVVGTQQFSSLGVAAVGAASSLTVSNPLNLLLYNSSLNIGATIADLEQKSILQILAEPTITSLSGQTASFLSGGEFPFPVVQGGSGSTVSVTVQFRPYGVKLEFTPFVNADGTIRLKVAPEVSALDYTNEVVISGYDIPAIDTRRAQTEVELKDGQSFAISGLLDHRITDQFSRMPGIASVPILGELFKSKSKVGSTVELIVIVTPQIVDPLNSVTSPALPVMTKPFLDNKKFDEQENRPKR